MTMHYHGVPLSSHARNIYELAGRNLCVSYATGENLAAHCHDIAQSIMLDNGAFTYWRRFGGQPAPPNGWAGYYEWAEPWLEYRTTWAVIPDVIGGTERENDDLLDEWPFGLRGAPVWHMHESIHRLKMLCAEWPRVCIGSSGDYATVGTDKWHWRMITAMNELCGDGPAPTWLHMLRGMNQCDAGYPFASVDSTDIGQNHHRQQNTIRKMADRWDALQARPRWRVMPVQEELVA